MIPTSRRKGAAYGPGGSIGQIGKSNGCRRKVTVIETFSSRALLIDADGVRSEFPNVKEAEKFARKKRLKVDIRWRFGSPLASKLSQG